MPPIQGLHNILRPQILIVFRLLSNSSLFLKLLLLLNTYPNPKPHFSSLFCQLHLRHHPPIPNFTHIPINFTARHQNIITVFVTKNGGIIFSNLVSKQLLSLSLSSSEICYINLFLYIPTSSQDKNLSVFTQYQKLNIFLEKII